MFFCLLLATPFLSLQEPCFHEQKFSKKSYLHKMNVKGEKKEAMETEQ